jgi:phosphoribosylaminoimidazole carboxylase (NCAIR synthetase)
MVAVRRQRVRHRYKPFIEIHEYVIDKYRKVQYLWYGKYDSRLNRKYGRANVMNSCSTELTCIAVL